MNVTNNTGIPLPMAVWLLHDEYDFIDEENYISATRLMRPLRHIILPSRVPKEQRKADVSDFIASSLGKSLHDSNEKAWTHGNHRASMKKLGYPDSVIDRVLVNPTPEELAAIADPIPVYIEQRAMKSIAGYKIGGKYDMVADGIVHDIKSTSAYTWLYGGRDEEHCLQGSIYRWLNPDKITEDFIRINYIFTDWQRVSAMSNPKYPQSRLQTKDIPLMSLAETEKWIINKLNLLDKNIGLPESQLPECTEEELWRSETQYKYYTNPDNTTGRSTKNFTNPSEAKMFMAEKGGKGVILTIPGEVKRCGYCDAYDVCTQKDKYHG